MRIQLYSFWPARGNLQSTMSLVFKSTFIRPFAMRAASTAPSRGLPAILAKNPEDVVITFAKRTPIGRAKKGQWKDTPVDELLQGLFKVTIPLRNDAD